MTLSKRTVLRSFRAAMASLFAASATIAIRRTAFSMWNSECLIKIWRVISSAVSSIISEPKKWSLARFFMSFCTLRRRGCF